MSAHAVASPLPRGRRTAVVAVAAAVTGAVAILVAMTVAGLVSGAGQRTVTRHAYTAPGQAFTVAVPDGWRAVTGTELAKVAGEPAAVIRRADGRGIVVVRRIGTLHGDLREIATGLTRRLERRLAGFRLVGARLGRVRAGGAFLYTFVRGAHGTAQSLAITSVNGATYRIDTVVPGDALDAARQAGAIVASFGPS